MPAPFFPSLPPSPPYGVTTPRVLVRWNDINSQNGPLTRVRGFFAIPAISVGGSTTETFVAPDFSLTDGFGFYYYKNINPLTPGKTYRWAMSNNDIGIYPSAGIGPSGPAYLTHSGMFVATTAFAIVASNLNNSPTSSQLFAETSTGPTYVNPIQPSIARRVAQINFTVISKKSFSIVDLSPFTNLTLNTGWTVTIAWATLNRPENIVTRYILASAGSLDFNVVGALATFPFYFNQAIPSTFCIEVWDMGVGAYTNGVVLPNILNIFSSILGTSDYRYGVDFNIATQANVINPVSINGPVYNFPINFNAIVPIGITPTLTLIKALSDENFDILTNEPGSELIPG